MRELSKSIFVDTFAPPTIARMGCIGSSRYSFKLSNSSCSNNPAPLGRSVAIACIEACSLCEHEKVSLI